MGNDESTNKQNLPFATLTDYRAWYEQNGGVVGWAELASWKNANEFVGEVFQCECERREVRHSIYSNGSTHYFLQCVRCGAYEAIKKSHPLVMGLADTPPLLDKDLADEWRESQWDLRGELTRMATELARRKRNKEWWEKYNNYLNSPKWRRKRAKVLKRDNYLCQACLERDATEVHHTTYEFVFNEPLFTLVAVCTPCHSFITKLSRGEVQ